MEELFARWAGFCFGFGSDLPVGMERAAVAAVVSSGRGRRWRVRRRLAVLDMWDGSPSCLDYSLDTLTKWRGGLL